jgi:hypothetical protein
MSAIKGKLGQDNKSREVGKFNTYADVWVKKRAGDGQYIEWAFLGFP